jgi:p-hydroxybenzoate 3-monooxygenase
MPATSTQVAIIGAGPAGLVLGQLLTNAGIDCVVIESHSREYVEHRVRAGVLEQGSVDLLRSIGAAARLDREGMVHHGIELRFDSTAHRIPLSDLTGASIFVYGQQEVVKDLIAVRLASGGRTEFEAEALAVDDLAAAPVVTYRQGGAVHRLRCEFAAGCDGFHGVSRAAVPAGAAAVFDRTYPFAWLGILAAVPPSTPEVVYAHHQRGFALHSMRSPSLSRLYVQMPPDDEVEGWPDQRIWEELAARLAVPGFDLEPGPILEKGITAMRSFVMEPMQFGRLFLAGDAAHIVPPTGAKGMNLAMSDARVLAEGIIAALREKDPAPLEAYSNRCLQRVWRAEHFSWWMTAMLHRFPSDDPFDHRLQLAQLRYVAASRAAATSLAENYVGRYPVTLPDPQ